MKRKAIVLLSSVLASALLVGGSFAAYAVTDNADPFGINVTPGDLDVDDTTYVTLNWGDTTSLQGVGNLNVGENRKAGVVSLKATPAYTGVFSLSIADTTTAEKQAGDAKFIDYLNVYVYDGDQALGAEGALPSGTGVTKLGEITKATAKQEDGKTKVFEKSLQGTPAGRELTVIVSLDSSASPVYAQMSQDKVRLTVDWGAQDGDESTENLVYYSKPSGWAKVYAFAWKGEKVNAAWPGVEMVKAYDSVYQISVPADMTNIIFNNGSTGEGNQTNDLSLAGYAAATPYWNGSAWAAKPEQGAVSAITCTKNGVAVALTDIVEEEDQQNDHIYKLTLAVGDKIVFKNGPETVLVGGASEYTVTVEGEHTFWYSKDGSIYVGTPAVATVYYVVGIINGESAWTSDAHPLIANSAAEGEFMLENPIALKANDRIKVRTGTTYFPEGNETEWLITADGNYNIYFRPAGSSQEGWNGYFYIGAVSA